MNSPAAPRSSSHSVFVLAALLVGVFGTAGIAIVHLHRQMHQNARERVERERALTRVESSILDCRGRIEQLKSLALAEERRPELMVRGLYPVRSDRVARVPGVRPDTAVAFVPSSGTGASVPR